MNHTLNSNTMEEEFLYAFDDYISPIPTNNTELSSTNIQHSQTDFTLNNTQFRASYPQTQELSSNPTSFDVYGNELVLNRIDLPNYNDELFEANVITEDVSGIVKFDKENNDPFLNLITPLKRRGNQIGFSGSFGSDRSGTTSGRSPLINITPILPKKTSDMGSKIEVG